MYNQTKLNPSTYFVSLQQTKRRLNSIKVYMYIAIASTTFKSFIMKTRKKNTLDHHNKLKGG